MPIHCTVAGVRNAHSHIEPLPYEDGTLDSIEVVQDIALLPHSEAGPTLHGWSRKLKQGGWLRVCVQDFDKAVDAYRNGAANDVEARLLGPTGGNGSLWNRAKLTEAMRVCELDGIRPWRGMGDAMCVALEGQRVQPLVDLSGVEALMSMPRLSWTENMFCAISALVPLKVNITKHTGAFWGQCLSRLMEDALKKPTCQWLLTLDYDTIFSIEDVRALYRLAVSHNLDAVAATQVGRERNTVLITCHDEHGNARTSLSAEELAADTLQVATAHFGLTLIRADKLRNLPRPWFHGSPAADGSWGEGRVDDDIQFWRQWERAGLKVWQANRIKVGHMQVVVSWPDHALQARHQYHNDYIKHGKPDFAR